MGQLFTTLDVSKANVRSLSFDGLKNRMETPLPDENDARQEELIRILICVFYLIETMIKKQRLFTAEKVNKKTGNYIVFIEALFNTFGLDPNYRNEKIFDEPIVEGTINDVKKSFFDSLKSGLSLFEAFIKKGFDREDYCYDYTSDNCVKDLSLTITKIFLKANADINGSNEKHLKTNAIELSLQSEINFNNSILRLLITHPSFEPSFYKNHTIIRPIIMQCLFYNDDDDDDDDYSKFLISNIEKFKYIDFQNVNSEGLTILEEIIKFYTYADNTMRKFNKYQENMKLLISHHKIYPKIIDKCLLLLEDTKIIALEELKLEVNQFNRNGLIWTKYEYKNKYITNEYIPFLNLLRQLLLHHTFTKKLEFNTLSGDRLAIPNIDYTNITLEELKKGLIEINKEIFESGVEISIIDFNSGEELKDSSPASPQFLLKPQKYTVVFR
jgi:hypothetical protein